MRLVAVDALGHNRLLAAPGVTAEVAAFLDGRGFDATRSGGPHVVDRPFRAETRAT